MNLFACLGKIKVFFLTMLGPCLSVLSLSQQQISPTPKLPKSIQTYTGQNTMFQKNLMQTLYLLKSDMLHNSIHMIFKYSSDLLSKYRTISKSLRGWLKFLRHPRNPSSYIHHTFSLLFCISPGNTQIVFKKVAFNGCKDFLLFEELIHGWSVKLTVGDYYCYDYYNYYDY